MTPTRGRIESLVMRIQTPFLENPMLSLTLRLPFDFGSVDVRRR